MLCLGSKNAIYLPTTCGTREQRVVGAYLSFGNAKETKVRSI